MLQPIGHHMRMRLEVDKVIARSDPERRQLARTILQRSQPFDLLAFGAVDTHLHLMPAEQMERSVELCRRIAISWRLMDPDGPRLVTLPPKPIKDQWHLQNTFNYILDQEPRHGCEVDLFHEASVLPDLLGLRVMGTQVLQNVRQLLPRVQRSQLLARLGPVDLERPFTSLASLGDAAAAAAVLPDLEGKDDDRRLARLAAIQVAGPHLSSREIAELIGLKKRRVDQLQQELKRGRPVDKALARAVELQLRLRSGMAQWLERAQPELNAWHGAPLSSSRRR